MTRRRKYLIASGIILVSLVGAGGAARYALVHSPDAEPVRKARALSVNTVTPQRKTLVRTHEQPGSIQPIAQAELYAKASGYLRSIRRELTPAQVATLLSLTGSSTYNPGIPIAGLMATKGVAFAVGLNQPPLDIGSRVHAGEVLLEVEVPEREQDVMEREAALKQRQEELGQVATMVATCEAAIRATQALEAQARAEVKRYQAEYSFRNQELTRVKDLAAQRAVERRLVDEKQAQVDAARAALECSRAKVQSALAEVALANTKLATARADVRVKEAQVNVARVELDRTRILLNYGRLMAPFSGVITYRGVDEGDFVQNSRSGQSRHLMTVTAIDRVKMVLQVPSREAMLVRVGASATVTVDAYPGEKFVGVVARTRQMLDLQSRTLQVEIDLDNTYHRLVPGLYGHVSLTLTTIPNSWVIPATALFSRNKINYILVVENGIARRQQVRIAFDDGDHVGVVKVIRDREVPLDGHEELIVSGKGEIADGQRVRSPHSPQAVSMRK